MSQKTAEQMEKENEETRLGIFGVIKSRMRKNKIDEYRRNNAYKFRAQAAVARELIRGNLVRPCICSKCGKERRIDAHHWSYELQHWLDVIWLCKSCHRLLHIAEKREKEQSQRKERK